MRKAGALAALVTAAMEAGKLREAAVAVTGTQSWCAQLRQWQSAAAEAGRLWERRRQRLGASGLRWEGENVKLQFSQPPPLFI